MSRRRRRRRRERDRHAGQGEHAARRCRRPRRARTRRARTRRPRRRRPEWLRPHGRAHPDPRRRRLLGARLTAHPKDIVSAVKLAESDVAEARMTGDVTGYLRAEQAADAAIVAQPGYLPAQSMRASILVSLHRFPQAREVARWILYRSPADSTALGVLGDASLELGDLTTAATAYSRLAIVADGSAAQVRAARLAFVEGDPAAAVAGDRRRGTRRPPTRGSRATRSASTTSRSARRSWPRATRPVRGRHTRRPSRPGPTCPRPSSGWPGSTPSTARCRRRSRSSTRPSRPSRCPTRSHVARTC